MASSVGLAMARSWARGTTIFLLACQIPEMAGVVARLPMASMAWLAIQLRAGAG